MLNQESTQNLGHLPTGAPHGCAWYVLHGTLIYGVPAAPEAVL